MKAFKSLLMTFLALFIFLVSLGGGGLAEAASRLKSISLDAPDSIRVGKHEEISVEAKYSDKSRKNVEIDSTIVTSDDDGKVRITKTGVLDNRLKMTGTKAGYVTVDVSYTEGSITKTTYKNIKVEPRFTITFHTVMDVGETHQTTPKVYYEINNPEIVTNTVNYSSSNPSVATISRTGYIKAIAPGITTIKATTTDKVFGKTLVESYDLTVE
ncbi:Ig-like domain-containing protein [Brevibacillus laterosporus]|uniref:Ig-like domain-containing protein n=1 Tax=Brevibacillus halotolerans TaxID=1507437 RepID=A0ABT4HXY2_9BACL|nr:MULTISPECIES: Ig-like domain-containing protein [Brevibacillus]MCR8985859.1 Ig-like domain-containing protein [Brevibacillus laterosporus]MCZ0831592.1 Ig-like domain-containing protein [Brevibacillus halotolerans]